MALIQPTADSPSEPAQPLSTPVETQPAPGFSQADWEAAVREGRVILVTPPGPRLPVIARQLLGVLRLVALTVSSVRRRMAHLAGSPPRTARGLFLRCSRTNRS